MWGELIGQLAQLGGGLQDRSVRHAVARARRSSCRLSAHRVQLLPGQIAHGPEPNEQFAGAAALTTSLSPEGHTGKSVVALGLVDLLARRVRNVGVFRPITRSTAGDDQVVKLLLEQVGADLSYEACLGVTYEDVHADPDAALATIVERYLVIERGARSWSSSAPTTPTSPVRPSSRSMPGGRQSGRPGAARRERVRADARRCGPGRQDRHCRLAQALPRRSVWWPTGAPRWSSSLSATGCPGLSCERGRCPRCRCCRPLVGDLMTALDGEMLFGDEAMLQREAEHMLVCGMNVEHVLA